MEKMFNDISIIAGLFGGLVSYIFGGWDTLLWTLIIFMALDYLTGVLKGIYTKKLSSDISFKGLIKKIIIVIMVVVANTLQRLLGNSIPVRETVIVFYIVNEGISLLENAAVILPDMPDGIKNILLQLREGK